MPKSRKSDGFTLVELLVVIAIVAILSLVVMLVVNPIEFLKRGRDVTRLSDLQNLQQAISVALQDATSSASQILCNGGSTPCSGKSNVGTRKVDGTGWVTVNIGAQKSVTLATLPIDPTNTATYHYTYCSDGNNFELDTVLESQQYMPKMSGDGGDDNNYFETGSALNLISASGGSCTY